MTRGAKIETGRRNADLKRKERTNSFRQMPRKYRTAVGKKARNYELGRKHIELEEYIPGPMTAMSTP
jgi:hypothetical protein